MRQIAWVLLVVALATGCGESSKDFVASPAYHLASEESVNTGAYDEIAENEFLRVTEDPLSTFAIDVDTASYSNIRRFLSSGKIPPPGAVRIEEMVNYFPYAYAPPQGDKPFAASVEVAGCPWNTRHHLVRVGLKAREIPAAERPPCNLVFLLDVSGSMNAANKLQLVKRSLQLLVSQLTEEDRVAIAVYAGAAGLVLPSTPGSETQTILSAIESLSAGGSTDGGSGIRLAYATAAKGLRPDGVNRVILATDGDFNVGTTNRSELIRLVREKAAEGVDLTVLGFGTGNIKDSTLEQIADKGNGSYAYIDSIQEARKVLVDQSGSTLVTVAKDVKIQVEFNPQNVTAYRLIGYENRLLAARDFNDDTKDAGEIGAGHTVTAFYEVIPAGLDHEGPKVDPLRYQETPQPKKDPRPGELLHVKVRYKLPDETTSRLLKFPVPVPVNEVRFETASDDLRFGAAVASFGMLLRDSKNRGQTSYESVKSWAGDAKGSDPGGWRTAFLDLVGRAETLSKK